MERIPYEKTKEENSVELLFAEKFKNIPTNPMEDKTAEILISLTIAPIQEDDEEINKHFLCQVIEKRFKALGYTMNIKCKLFLAYLTNSPGMAVMYCHYLAYWCKQNNIQHLTLDELCMNIFPMGFPSENDLSVLWDEQKVKRDADQPGTDNLLDYFHASKSIMAETDI